MALSARMTEAFNDQITAEVGAAYRYLAMSAWLETASLPGMAHWMRLQADEEWSHALRFYRFVLDRDGVVVLGAIPAPKNDYESPLDIFEAALSGEQEVSVAINGLYGTAMDEKDFASLPLLDWFVNEQVEEEASMTQIIDDLRRAGTGAEALLLLDREMGGRSSGAV